MGHTECNPAAVAASATPHQRLPRLGRSSSGHSRTVKTDSRAW